MSEFDVINFTNIDNEDYTGVWGGEPTIIKAGETKPFPIFLANHYAKHLVNKILLREGRDFGDETLRKPLIDAIIGKAKTPAEEVVVTQEVPKEEVFEGLPEEPIKEPEKPAWGEEFQEEKPKPKRVRKPKAEAVE